MSILDFFVGDRIPIDIYRDVITNDSGAKKKVRTLISTELGLFWEGSEATAFMSARFRDTAHAVIAFDYGVDVKKDDVVALDGESYKVLGTDNIGKVYDVLLLYLEFSG